MTSNNSYHLDGDAKTAPRASTSAMHTEDHGNIASSTRALIPFTDHVLAHGDFKLDPYTPEAYSITEKPTMYSADGSVVEIELPSSCHIAVIEWPKPNPDFTIFNRLPYELRLRIWYFALPAARLVLVTTIVTRYEMTVLMKPIGQVRYDKEMQRLRLVCRESRDVFESNYRVLPILGSSIGSLWDEDLAPENYSGLGNNDLQFRNTGPWYVDERRDTLFIHKNIKDIMEKNAWLDMSRLTNLAVRTRLFTELADEGDTGFCNIKLALEFVEQCRVLKTLTLEIYSANFPNQNTGYKFEPHFLEINRDFADYLPAQVIGPWSESYQRYASRLARKFLNNADDVRREIQGYLADNPESRLRMVEIKVCTLATIEGPAWLTKMVNLLPTNPQYSDVCFRMEMPFRDTSVPHYLLFDWAKTPCRYDGTINWLEPYESISEMFRQAGDEE
ncbi:uncharacterized protein L3040_003052 [Drepanopeziza brunnea f. sp. 'multigermtubi']|uniref:uncharacterized protein n=1 Tax=Drepanopeziza brunnea f. sp. 'multigermtubi' TaxID=698441 RepID=UPI0023932BBD|nr:hypothetical protein L3040_003052 [Drepanopeziza brunnea f. sp. 'multigermtubi']